MLSQRLLDTHMDLLEGCSTFCNLLHMSRFNKLLGPLHPCYVLFCLRISVDFGMSEYKICRCTLPTPGELAIRKNPADQVGLKRLK